MFAIAAKPLQTGKGCSIASLVYRCAVLRDGKHCSCNRAQVGDIVGNRKLVALKLLTFSIEALRHQGAVVKKKQIARRDVGCIRTGGEQEPVSRGIERRQVNGAGFALICAEIDGSVEEMSSIGQKCRPAI